jgi:hypothetical protein
MGPPRPLIQCLLGVSSWEMKRLRREPNHLPSSGVEVRNVYGLFMIYPFVFKSILLFYSETRKWRTEFLMMECERGNCLSVFFQCHHMSLMDFVVSPPGCGRSVTDFWGWDAHEAQLRCPDEVDEYEVQGGALNLHSTKLPRPWSPWGSSPSRKNPHGRTGNRPRDLMISSQKLWPLDHEAGRLSVMLGCTSMALVLVLGRYRRS